MTDFIFYLISLIALVGNYLNIVRDWRSFLFWSFTNAVFMLQTIYSGSYFLSLVFAANLVTSILGYYLWRNNLELKDLIKYRRGMDVPV